MGEEGREMKVDIARATYYADQVKQMREMAAQDTDKESQKALLSAATRYETLCAALLKRAEPKASAANARRIRLKSKKR